MSKKVFSNVKQQFPLASDVNDWINELAESLDKKPNDLKREILTAFKGMNRDKYYISLGKIQELSNSSRKIA